MLIHLTLYIKKYYEDIEIDIKQLLLIINGDQDLNFMQLLRIQKEIT